MKVFSCIVNKTLLKVQHELTWTWNTDVRQIGGGISICHCRQRKNGQCLNMSWVECQWIINKGNQKVIYIIKTKDETQFSLKTIIIENENQNILC